MVVAQRRFIMMASKVHLPRLLVLYLSLSVLTTLALLTKELKKKDSPNTNANQAADSHTICIIFEGYWAANPTINRYCETFMPRLK